jgi:hypothetical protein
MWEILLWLFSLITASLVLGAFWNRAPREGRRKPVVLPALGTAVVLGTALGLLLWIRWLDDPVPEAEETLANPHEE